MSFSLPSIRPVNTKNLQRDDFAKHLADCVLLSHDHKILLQKRPENWGNAAGRTTLFGGHVEECEIIIEGLIREIEEELGAKAKAHELKLIGAVTEDFTAHTELVHIYFWHDKHNTITGCYEAQAVCYNTVNDALAEPTLMDYVHWALMPCETLINAGGKSC